MSNLNINTPKIPVEQRIKFYNKAIEDIKSERETYICHSLMGSVCSAYKIPPHVLFDGKISKRTKALFPEFYAQKPKSAFTHGAWFESVKERVDALNEAIKLAENGKH